MKLNCKPKNIKIDEYFQNYEGTLAIEFENDFQLILDYYFTNSGGYDSGGEDKKCLKYLFNFLNILNDKNFPDDHSGEWYTVMNLFEDNDISESGVSIRCGWLTEKGKFLLKDCKTIFKG